MRGASSIRYMLRSGGARVCTLILIIVLGTLYLPSFHFYAEDDDELFPTSGNNTIGEGAPELAPAKALIDAVPPIRAHHRCPAPRTAKVHQIDRARQLCTPLKSALPAFAVSLCYERDAYDAFTVRARRVDQKECARLEAKGPQVEDEQMREWVRKERGPDTLWLRVDGAERISTQWSTYEGGCAYRFDVHVRNAGDLYVDLWHAYEDYQGFVEGQHMRALPWPPLLQRRLLEQPIRLPWAASDCRPYTVPPIFESHLTEVPAPLTPADQALEDLPPCTGDDPIRGSYYPANSLDVLWPEWNYPQPHGRPVGGRYRFMPHDCEWRHAGMRASTAHRCTRRRESVYMLGDSHGRIIYDGMVHRLNGTGGVMHASHKLEFKSAKVGQVEFAFQWDPRGELIAAEPQKICAALIERKVDVFFASIAFHLALDEPTHVFLDRLEAVFDAVHHCTKPADRGHGQHGAYSGPRTRVLVTPAAVAPRQDGDAAASKQKSTNARHAYWAALAAPVARARGWAVLDQFALTEPMAWEPMFTDRLHYLLTDAHEAIVDEAVGRTGLCPDE
ncbi:hypothetical protein BD626DRAFT_524622 [Schizophyllum amplum]|uniref:Uncharacterized protein n=1 Tax=Schizophyllum amplum TaxID=97359 RepID=A0A550BSV1_9AGAR|nr:hypothetical protein BD626DRAFT_524622 [Auriculariopsis ampla]